MNELVVMFDLEFLSKDEPNGQILDIGIAYGTHPSNLQRVVYRPRWQEDGAIQPSTLKFWVEQNPSQLSSYLDNHTPMSWIARDLLEFLHMLKGHAKQLKVDQVVLMSKGITHDLPKLEYQINQYCGEESVGGLGVFESLFGYNCRRDLRSFKMGRDSKTLKAAREYAERHANQLMPEGVLHDAEYDALVQWFEFYFIATFESDTAS